jgi:L-threonylcarbamoyladenylate synthase
VSYNTNNIDDKVAELLKSGGVGLLPTDTIYGLSALALNKKAVEKVHQLKLRDNNKPLVVLIANLEQLAELGLSDKNIGLIKPYWPGPLSVEFDASSAPKWLNRGMNYFAIRLPDHAQLRDLIAETGPLVSTSANLQGQEPAKNVEEAKSYFGEKLDFYVDFGNLKCASSTLVKIENGNLKVLRQGAYELPENRMTQITRK